MSFKSVLKTIGLAVVVINGAFVVMLSFPQMLPEAWATPSKTPAVPTVEEVDAACCERVKLGKNQSCSCEADTQPIKATAADSAENPR